MAVATKADQSVRSEVRQPEKSLVWFGCLPAPESVEMREGTRDKDAATRDYFRIVKKDPAELWITPTDARTWVGKCRFYQSLAVRGFVFPAFSEIVERHATIETEMIATPFPGAVKIMKRQEVDRIIASCWRHVVRFKAGNSDLYSLKNSGRTEVVDLEMVRKPDSWTDEQWVAERQRIPMDIPVFDPDTDIPIAHFVYLVQVQVADFSSLHDGMGNLDVGQCVTHLPNQRLDRKFFSGPPQSVAEMYPQKQ